jgi:hypothetical protein
VDGKYDPASYSKSVDAHEPLTDAPLIFHQYTVVVLFLPLLEWFAVKVLEFADELGISVAWAQLTFNVVMSLAVLLLLRIFEHRLRALDGNAP